MRFLAYTGLRCGELAGLNIGDVKLRHVHVHRTRAKTTGGWQVDLPKTQGSDREVPLPGWLATDLAAYLATHPRRHDPDAPLWPGRHRYPDLRTRGLLNWDEPWERGVFAKAVFKPALARAGLAVTVRLHDLRHTTSRSWRRRASRPTASPNTPVTPTCTQHCRSTRTYPRLTRPPTWHSSPGTPPRRHIGGQRVPS